MEIRVLQLLLIQSVIASGSVNKLWVIEGNRIEIPAPAAADNVTSNKIDAINWFNNTNMHVNNNIISLVHPNKDRYSIDVTDQTYGDLIIEPVYRTDAGYYICQVVGTELGVSWKYSYYLDVYYMDPPTISTTSTRSTAKNSNTTFFCTWSVIYPNTKPVVAWFLDGSELNITKTKFILKEEDGKRTLVIHNISEIDFGNYTCSITVDTNRGVMNKMSKNFEKLGLDLSEQKLSDKSKLKIVISVSVSVVIFTVCIIGFAVSYQDRKYASSRKNKFPFELLVEEEFFCNEGESASMVLTYEPKHAKIASVSWFKIDKEQDRTDHLLTFDSGSKRIQKAPARNRLPSLRPMKMEFGVDTENLYSGMDLESVPANNNPGPSYFVLDNVYDDIKTNAIKSSEAASDERSYNYIENKHQGDSLKKSKEIGSADRYAVSLEEVGSFRLTIDNLIPSDAGVYKFTVVMKNDETHLQTSTLFVKPNLVAHVRDVEVEEGSSAVSIICELFPKDSDIKTTTWFKKDRSYTEAIASNNDDYVQSNPKYEAVIDKEHGRGLLTITNIIIEDRGRYVCVVRREGDTEGDSTRGDGTLSVACNLTVRVYNQKAMVGDKSTFVECRILPPGENIIGVMWYRYNEHGKFNGNVLASTNDIARPDSKYCTELDDSGMCTLFINDVVKADAGKYVCKVMRTFQMKLFKGSALLTVETE